VELLSEQLVHVEVAKRLLKRFWKWEYAWLSLIVIGSLILHFIVISRPAEPLFDEQHYVPDARTVIEYHGTNRTEHPPLGKLLIASGIEVFGDNPWGWRIPSVAFGTLGVVFFYLMCRNLRLSRRAASIGTAVLATENLYFVHAGISMLDIFTVSFMLLAFWLYARRSYPLSGVAVALATLTKFNGVFAVFAIIIHWFFCRRDKKIEFVSSLMLSGLSFMLLLVAFDFIIYRHLVDFIGLLKHGLDQTGSLTFESAKHVSMSRPWEWVFNLEIMPYWYGPHYIGLVSFSVWALSMPALLYMAFRTFKRDTAGLFGVVWYFATWVVWIPLSLVTNRVSFIFYFLPTVPAICLGIAMGLDYLITYWQKPKRQRVLKPAGADVMALAPPPAVSEPFPSLASPAEAEAAPQSPPPSSGVPGQPEDASLQSLAGLEPVPAPVLPQVPHKWWRKGKLQWAGLVFTVVFSLVHAATFVIVAPPLNNWHIENWHVENWFRWGGGASSSTATDTVTPASNFDAPQTETATDAPDWSGTSIPTGGEMTSSQ
jgi:dolichyl-phosphate-mannose-protein mannosyltransferase